MLIVTLIALSFTLASLFIPGIEARNISQDETQVLNSIFFIMSLISYFPTLFLPALSLLIFGWVNKQRYNLYLFLAGIFSLVYYVGSFIFSFYLIFTGPLYPPNFFIQLFNFWLRIIIYGISISAYIFLLLQGVLNKQPLFRNTAITMIGTFIFGIFFSSFIYQIIFTFFRGM
jgi:hypothetical protein